MRRNLYIVGALAAALTVAVAWVGCDATSSCDPSTNCVPEVIVAADGSSDAMVADGGGG